MGVFNVVLPRPDSSHSPFQATSPSFTSPPPPTRALSLALPSFLPHYTTKEWMSLTALLTPHLTLHPPHITHQIRTLLTLLQSQQTTTNLPVHPLIASHTEIQQEWLNDDQLLNEIQATTTQWIREINETVQTERDIKSGGLKEEKEFWIEMERKVEGIEKRLAEKDVGKEY